VPVVLQVTADDVGHGRVVVDDDDPAWRIGVIYQGIPFWRPAKSK
jgi:hypothetical protein